jgi:hypothetical protein
MGCFVSGPTIKALLEKCEKAVGGTDGDWRPDKKGQGKRG